MIKLVCFFGGFCEGYEFGNCCWGDKVILFMVVLSNGSGVENVYVVCFVFLIINIIVEICVCVVY